MGKEILKDIVLLLDKHEGITSNDAVNTVKKLSGIRKIGHSGTLDKFASGLLVVCTGRATKLTRYFLDSNKQYRGIIKLGVRTDTCDSEGKIISRSPFPSPDPSLREGIVAKFTGEQFQVPPVYSALKIGGRRASDLVRAGENIELTPRKVFIEKLSITAWDANTGTITVDIVCSKGTYIRSLARDIGEELECGAHLAALRRSAAGNFSVDDAVTIDELKEYFSGAPLKKACIHSPQKALSHFNRIVVSETATSKILNGGLFLKSDILEMEIRGQSPFVIVSESQNLIAIADVDINNWSVRYLNVFNN